MKKFVALMLVCLLTVGIALTLTSCGLSGTYKDSLGVTTYKFSGSKVTLTVKVGPVETSFNGKYSLGKDDDGNKTITFTFEGEGSDKYSGTVSFGEGKDDNGSYIKIGGVSFYKQ